MTDRMVHKATHMELAKFAERTLLEHRAIVELLASRAAAGQDIWTGEQLACGLKYVGPSDMPLKPIAVPRHCIICGNVMPPRKRSSFCHKNCSSTYYRREKARKNGRSKAAGGHTGQDQ